MQGYFVCLISHYSGCFIRILCIMCTLNSTIKLLDNYLPLNRSWLVLLGVAVDECLLFLSKNKILWRKNKMNLITFLSFSKFKCNLPISKNRIRLSRVFYCYYYYYYYHHYYYYYFAFFISHDFTRRTIATHDFIV